MPTIRAYESTDHDGVVNLWREVFGYATAHNDPALVIAKKCANNDGLFWVAECATGIVGTVMAGYDGHRGWLYAVAVHPQQRNAGLGSRLVRAAEDALSQKGCVKINLQLLGSNEATAAFYRSLNYSVEARISMGKVLDVNVLDK